MMATQTEVELTCNCCIRGYHVYMNNWRAVVDVLHCEPQNKNVKDYYAVAVCKEDNEIVGHIPMKISRVCWLFLNKPGCKLLCYVTGGHRHSPQGGLEFMGPSVMVRKVFNVLQEEAKDNTIFNNICFTFSEQ